MLQDIPSTVLAKVFAYLPEEYVKKVVKLVCKRWYEVVQERCHPAIQNSMAASFDVEATPLDGEATDVILEDLRKYHFITSTLKSFIKNQVFRKRIYRKEKYVSQFERTNKSENISKTSQTFPVIKFGLYSEKISICIRKSDDIDELLNEILFRRPKLRSFQVSHLNIQLISNDRSIYHSDGDMAHPLYLSGLIEVIGGGLESLSIQDSSCSLQNQCFDIRSGKKFNRACFLRAIKIVSPNSTMTKVCLRYLISSNFGSLDDLQSFLKLGKPHDGSQDDIWTQLKSFCLVKLEGYNVFFRDGSDGSKLFSFDNCDKQDRTYENRYKNFDSSDSFTLIDNNREGYQINWEDDWS